MKTLVQCDFDGTVTYKDVSFQLLDEFAGAEWREYWDRHEAGKLTVGRFNELAFSMVKATRQEMLEYVDNRFRLRPGLKTLVDFCRKECYRLAIVSNGLDFYIDHILKTLGVEDVEHHAAESVFGPSGMKVRYVGADGSVVDTGFKESYVVKFLNEGYRIAYIGNGSSDISPAKRCQLVFATGALLEHYRQHGMACVAFDTFTDIAKTLETW